MYKQNILDLRDEVIGLREKIKQLHEKENELLKKLRIECGKNGHETIYETPYEPENLVRHALAPKRICIICGLTEEGWGCGYKKLNKNPIKTVSKKEFGELWKLKPLISRMIIGG